MSTARNDARAAGAERAARWALGAAQLVPRNSEIGDRKVSFAGDDRGTEVFGSGA
jgi:hypothetical protein